jgi:hypothetical protein
MIWLSVVYKVFLLVCAILFVRLAVKVHAGGDKKFDKDEFDRMTAFFFFLGSGIYIIYKEANRPPDTAHIFSDIWIFFIISGILTVLSLEKMLVIMVNFAEALKGFFIAKSKENDKE